MRRRDVEQQRLEFTEFYTAARDERLQSARGQCGDQLVCGDDRVRVERLGEVVRSIHKFLAVRRRGVRDERHRVAKFYGEAAGAFDAARGRHACQDDVFNAVLAQLEIEVRGGKAVFSPVLVAD